MTLHGLPVPESEPEGDVRDLPRREPECYVSADELALRMGVSVRTIKQFTHEGMPSETWGLRARRYKPSEAIAWARTRGRNAAA